MTSSALDQALLTLADQGWVIIPNACELAPALAQLATTLDPQLWRQASIGRQQNTHENLSVRRDNILWLDDDMPALVQEYLAFMESIRQRVNASLFLGLFDYECHFAHYAAGTFYQKHRDAFAPNRGNFQSGTAANGSRKLSSVFYLNHNWQTGDGGELVLYTPESDNEITRVKPELGTLVLFLSEEFPHEVLPVNKPRWSLTGWFRTR